MRTLWEVRRTGIPSLSAFPLPRGAESGGVPTLSNFLRDPHDLTRCLSGLATVTSVPRWRNRPFRSRPLGHLRSATRSRRPAAISVARFPVVSPALSLTDTKVQVPCDTVNPISDISRISSCGVRHTLYLQGIGGFPRPPPLIKHPSRLLTTLPTQPPMLIPRRSEERRVGKECRL